MPTYKFTDARKLADQVMHSAERRKERLLSAIRDAVMKGEAIAQTEVDATQPSAPVDRGRYRAGFKYARLPNGAVLYNNVPYGPVIEDGRRPGSGISREGQEALARWVLRKGLVASGGSRGDREAAARGIAFVIARAIKRRGLPAKHVLARTEARLTPIVRKAIEEAMSA